MQKLKQTYLGIVLVLNLLLLVSSISYGQQVITLDSPDQSIEDYGTVLTTYFTRTITRGQEIDKEVKVILGAGEWKINSTVRLTLGDQLYLDYGASLKRTDCQSQAPLIHLDGRFSSVVGSAMNTIQSECDNLSKGLILVGHSNSTDNRNIISCRIEHVNVIGNYANYPNNESTGIFLYNNQNESLGGSKSANYFHTILDVDIAYVKVGIHLYNSNACTIDRILLNRVGAKNGQGILLEGAQETKIANVHHGQSPGSESITFRSSNRSYLPAYNTIHNYVIEIGKLKKPQVVPIDFNHGYCINFDVPYDEFIDNEINIICNHTHFAKTRSNVSFQDFKEGAPRSIIR